jgi:hypothetical protein
MTSNLWIGTTQARRNEGTMFFLCLLVASHGDTQNKPPYLP